MAFPSAGKQAPEDAAAAGFGGVWGMQVGVCTVPSPKPY